MFKYISEDIQAKKRGNPWLLRIDDKGRFRYLRSLQFRSGQLYGSLRAKPGRPKLNVLFRLGLARTS